MAARHYGGRVFSAAWVPLLKNSRIAPAFLTLGAGAEVLLLSDCKAEKIQKKLSSHSSSFRDQPNLCSELSACSWGASACRK